MGEVSFVDDFAHTWRVPKVPAYPVLELGLADKRSKKSELGPALHFGSTGRPIGRRAWLTSGIKRLNS